MPRGVPNSLEFEANENGCWIWPYTIGRDGYGKTNKTSAHRWVYEQLVGPVDAGLQLDHLCRVLACVNPDHLEPVTDLENKRRRYATYTHCVNGHEFTEANTYRRPTGQRDCRACIRDRVRRYQNRRASA